MSISENLFQAMDIIIAERLNGLDYDKTILCKIEDDSNKDKGEYIVTDGSSTFIAYSNDMTYNKGISVYVTIPTGDFNQKKLIVGKYVAENEGYYTYQDPFDQYINITENLIKDDISSGLVANGNTQEKVIWKWECEQGQGYMGYSRLGLSAGFRSWLAAMEPIAGKYGLRLDIRGTEKTTSEESCIEKNYKFFLSNEDFYGDTYNFDTYYKQEKVFDIDAIKEITRIQMVFYQEKDSFINKDKELIPSIDEMTSAELMNNLFMNEPILSLGYSVSEFDTDTVLLYTFDSVTYSPESETKNKPNGSPMNQKTLQARWIHFDDEGKCIAIDREEEIAEYEEKHSAKIHWYKHVLQDGVYDDLAGNFWQEVNDGQEAKNLSYTFNPDIAAATESYKVIIEMPSTESVKEQIIDEDYKLLQSHGVKNPNDDVELEEFKNNKPEEYEYYLAEIEEIQSSLLSTIKYYESDTFYFENEVQVPDQATLELVQGLSIIVDAIGLKGNYCIYGQTNEILNSTEGHKMRTMEARYESLITNDKRLDKASTIRWKIPAYGTMIYPPENGKEYIPMPNEYIINGEIKIPENDKNKFLYANREGYIGETKHTFIDENGKLIPIDGYYIIERNGTEQYPEGGLDVDGDEKEDTSQQISVMQDFRIESYYTPQNTNNTVYCEIIKNGLTYKASSTLVFGPQGTNGTDSTLVLKFKDDQSAIDKNGEIIVEAHLYDYNNTEVEIDEESISWQWWKTDDNFEATDGTLKITEIPKANWPEKTVVSTETDAAGNELSAEKKISYPIVKIQWNSNEEIALHNILQCNVLYGNATIGAQAVDGVNLETNETLPAPEEKDLIKRPVNLQAFIPIPFRNNPSLVWAEVPTRIVYDDQGKNPSYYKNAFAITTSGSVEGYVSNAEIIFDDIDSNYVYYPGVKYRDEDSSSPGWFLDPKNMFFNGLTNKITLKVTVAFNNNSQITYYDWYQPILMIQNRWPSAMMNAWDGSLTIDEKNGTILSTMVGAGKKEDDNTFTGVLMGDIATGVGYKDKQLGVYGFNHGQQSFGFKDDGTAFIGKTGKGRIEFDGNSGRIQSMSYSQTKNEKVKSGMLIDLDDGIIEMHGATKDGTNGNFENNTYKGSGAMIRLNVADNSRKPYFEIHTATGDDPLEKDPAKQKSRPIMIVGLEDYRLQSADFKKEKTNSPGSGMQIDLNKGRILGYDFELKGVDQATGSYFHMKSNGDPYFKVHHVDASKNQDLDLIRISKSQFYIQSPTFKSNQGMKIDIINSSMIAYDKNGKGDYIKISGNDSSFLQIYDANNSGSGGTTIMNCGNGSFYMQSSGYSETDGGLKINFKAGTIEGGVKNNDGVDKTWSIKKSGDATFNKITAKTGIIGPFNITTDVMYTGSNSFGDDGIYLNKNGNMSLGGSLKYENKVLTLNSANISKGTINNATIQNCNITTGMKLQGSNVSKRSITFLNDIEINPIYGWSSVIYNMSGQTGMARNADLMSPDIEVVYNLKGYTKYIQYMRGLKWTKTFQTISTLSTSGDPKKGSEVGEDKGAPNNYDVFTIPGTGKDSNG